MPHHLGEPFGDKEVLSHGLHVGGGDGIDGMDHQPAAPCVTESSADADDGTCRPVCALCRADWLRRCHPRDGTADGQAGGTGGI